MWRDSNLCDINPRAGLSISQTILKVYTVPTLSVVLGYIAQDNPNPFFASKTSKTNSISKSATCDFRYQDKEQGSSNIPFRTLTACRIGSQSELD
jgi:hypothetical protein